MPNIGSSPLKIALVAVCVALLYKFVYLKRKSKSKKLPEPDSSKVKKHDLTLDQMRKYDGRGASGRVFVAVNGKVFDVTRGKRLYGPGGPFAVFAGRDASRNMVTFSTDAIPDDYDDLSDLNTTQMESVREWEMQFKEKYDYVGRLLKPGEEPNDYSDDDDGSQNGTKTEDETRNENGNKSDKDK